MSTIHGATVHELEGGEAPQAMVMSANKGCGHGLWRAEGVHKRSQPRQLLAGDTESALALFVAVSAIGRWEPILWYYTHTCRCELEPPQPLANPRVPTHVLAAVAQTSMRSRAVTHRK